MEMERTFFNYLINTYSKLKSAWPQTTTILSEHSRQFILFITPSSHFPAIVCFWLSSIVDVSAMSCALAMFILLNWHFTIAYVCPCCTVCPRWGSPLEFLATFWSLVCSSIGGPSGELPVPPTPFRGQLTVATPNALIELLRLPLAVTWENRQRGDLKAVRKVR